MGTLAELENDVAELATSVGILVTSAVRTTDLSTVLSTFDAETTDLNDSITSIESDILLIKNKLTILLGSDPDVGAGSFVTTNDMAAVLRSYDAQRTDMNARLTVVERELADIRQKLTILSMQIDPVIAGTTTFLQGANDTIVSTTSSSYVTVKRGGLVRSTDMIFSKLILHGELRAVGGGTASLSVLLNSSRIMTVTTTSTGYVYRRDEWDWTGLDNETWYDLEFQIRNVGGGTTWNRGLELFCRKPGLYEDL